MGRRAEDVIGYRRRRNRIGAGDLTIEDRRTEMREAGITLERNGRQGRYLLPLPGGQPAHLTFVETRPDHIAIDYSFVPPSYRGRGVARKLIVRAVEDARAKGFRITPLCGYVAAEFRHHPQWSDVLEG
jgi:predicted GNAT family acetyltransferase